MSVTPGPWAFPAPSIMNGRSAAVPGSKTVSMWPINRIRGPPAVPLGPSHVPITVAPWMPAGSGRLIEIRLLEGPNVYRLEPAVKVELAIGRRRTWYGQRSPARHALVHLGARIPARDWPLPIEELVGWIRRLRIDHGEGRGGI